MTMRPARLSRLFGLLAAALALPGAAQDEPYALDRLPMRAQLSPQRYTTLSAELGAKVNRITVKEGERFRKGQVLIEFDCALQRAQFDKAKAQLAAADNTYTGNQRMAALNAAGQVELRNSEAEVMKARADLNYLSVTLDKCAIAAPFDGRAGEQKAREHQFVQTGQALLEILDDSALELELIVPSAWLTWLRSGHQFQVHIAETDKTYPVKLLRTAARADPVSQTIKAVAVIDGRFPELIAGMSGQVLLEPPAP